MDFSTNKDIRTLQVEAWRKPPGIATFIGAGCSNALKIPLWKQMLIGLNKEFGYYKSDADVESDINILGYPPVASNIRSKAPDEAAYKDQLRKYIKPQACYYTSLHVELVLLSNTIVTTNYDKSFESALDAINRFTPKPDCDYTTSSLGNFNRFGWGDRRHIFHIHGDIDSADVILTTESYSEQYDEPLSQVASLITSIFSSFTTLFIGFSFDDDYFINFLSKALEAIRKDAARYKTAIPKHYCIMSDSITKKHLTSGDLLSLSADIDQLLTEKVIEKHSLGPSGEFVFNVVMDPKDILRNITINDSLKKGLLSHIDTMDRNSKKLKILNDMGIIIIPFEGNNSLQIEHILMELNKRPSISAPSFIPN